MKNVLLILIHFYKISSRRFDINKTIFVQRDKSSGKISLLILIQNHIQSRTINQRAKIRSYLVAIIFQNCGIKASREIDIKNYDSTT